MTVQLRFFAAVRERLGAAEREAEVAEGTTVAALWADLRAAQPALEAFATSVAFAVNREYVDGTHRLAHGDEVAFIPPVSGGCGD